jgi:DNA-directed RNA polymerase specialized sigma subunit
MRVKIQTDPIIPPQDPNGAPHSHGDSGFTPYVPAWERLADASYWDKCIYCSAFVELQQIDDVLTPRMSSDEDDEVGIDIADPAWTAEELMEVEETIDEVAGFIASLPRREQEIVHRIFWLDETQTSVAQSLGVHSSSRRFRNRRYESWFRQGRNG